MPDVPVLILCGGRGTRLQEHSPAIPKPLVEIGGRPILWHVMSIYAQQGFREFVLCTGYKGELIEAFAAQATWPDGARVTCVDTGVDTPTGGRVLQAREHVGDRTFCVTYADGVADIDLGALQAFHASHAGLATITVVQPELPFGVVDLSDGGAVTGFREKPRAEQWINGGFFVFDARVFAHLEPDSVLERAPLEGLLAQRALHAYRHGGFWACLDTYKDAVRLNDLWSAGNVPWLRR